MKPAETADTMELWYCSTLDLHAIRKQLGRLLNYALMREYLVLYCMYLRFIYSVVYFLFSALLLKDFLSELHDMFLGTV